MAYEEDLTNRLQPSSIHAHSKVAHPINQLVTAAVQLEFPVVQLHRWTGVPIPPPHHPRPRVISFELHTSTSSFSQACIRCVGLGGGAQLDVVELDSRLSLPSRQREVEQLS